ncbi:MAG: efflux RND transporter permease subunit [Thermodesulfobacteriota bacterium]|nr:efflux RND transporter permease subunit [Thermodesulfobacteriota bacterium]
MFLPDFSIRRPVAATMMVAAIVVFGLIGLVRLGISLFPDVDLPIVTITTKWENARPEEVDNEITDKLEDAISSVSGIKHITSQSMQGRSRITVEFELSKDLDVASQEVRDKVSARLGKLPKEAEAPVIDKLDINAQPIIWLAITGQHAIEDLTRIADEQIRPLLQKIQGVGEVRLGGAREKEIQISLYRERLAAYNIGVDEVINAIRRQHIEIPGGKIESPDKEFLVRTIGEFETPEAFNDLIVAYRHGTPIRLGLLGYAKSGREEGMAVARYTTREDVSKTVALGVAPRSGANEVAIAKRVKKVLPEIRGVLPKGMNIEIASDNTRFIEESIDEIKFQLLLGAIMAALVILVFLQHFRTTVISAVAIPTSIIATFACIYAMGFTLNNMTMLALVTAVGLVIDDAIVVVENIFRHRYALGKGPMKAAFEGSSEVAFAVLAATVTLAGVFIPVAFMGGIVGRFFFQFAVTMAFAVACSLFVALTVVPMLCSRFLTLGGDKSRMFHLFDRAMDRLSRFYRKQLNWFLGHRFIVVVLTVVALVFGGWLFTLLGKEFITAEDKSKFLIRLETPLAYSIDKTDEVMRRLEKELRTIPEIEHFFSIGGADGSNKGVAVVSLVDRDQRTRTQKEIQAQGRRLLRELPDVRGTVSEISALGGRSRSEDIQLVVQGPDMHAIDRHTRAIMDRMSEIPGYMGITRDLEIGKPEVRVRINREKAADAGISVRNIASAVGALLGGIDVADYKEGGKSYDIRVRLAPEQRLMPGDVQRIWVRSNDGKLMDITSFIDIETGVGPNVINRLDRQRSATIYANLEGKHLGEAMAEVRRIAEEILPDAYSIKFSGRAEAFAETGQYVAFAFILAIIFTYMVLAAQFESFTQPFAIMMGLPLSFIGAFGLLFILGNTFNLFSMIGLVLLVGLATKNGILLIDYTNKASSKGLSSHDALVEAGVTRLRPILMTAFSTVAGVIPVAIGIGVGSESRQPMAVAIAGGMITSTLLTLAVVPVIYSYLDQLAHWKLFEKFKKKVMA